MHDVTSGEGHHRATKDALHVIWQLLLLPSDRGPCNSSCMPRKCANRYVVRNAVDVQAGVFMVHVCTKFMIKMLALHL